MSEENDDQYFHTYVPMVESALSAVVDDVLQRRPKKPLAEICSTLYEKYGRQTSGLRQPRTSSEAMVDSSSSGGLKMDAAGGQPAPNPQSERQLLPIDSYPVFTSSRGLGSERELPAAIAVGTSTCAGGNAVGDSILWTLRYFVQCM